MKLRILILPLALLGAGLPAEAQPHAAPPARMAAPAERLRAPAPAEWRCGRAPGVASPACQDARRLRNLQIREAVQAGEMGPRAARRSPAAPEDGWLQPDDTPGKPQGKQHFWRDKRKKALEQYQQQE